MSFVEIKPLEPPSDRMLIDALCIVIGAQLFERRDWGSLYVGISGADAVYGRAKEIVENYARMAMERITSEHLSSQGGAVGMLGRHKFHVGQRVQPSAEGLSAHLFKPRKGIVYVGTVEKVDRFNSPTVLWDGRRTTSTYAAEFIEPFRPASADAAPEQADK